MTIIDERISTPRKAINTIATLLITLCGLAVGAAIGIVIALSTGLIDLIC